MDIKAIQSMLTIDKHALDDALQVQAHYLDELGQEIVRAEAAVDLKADKLRTFEARVFVQHKSNGDSDKVASEKAKIHPDREGLQDNVAEADLYLKSLRSLYEAWKSRGFALKELVALHGVSYYALTPAGSDRPRIARTDYTEAPRQRRRAT